jgi:acyl carrier protein
MFDVRRELLAVSTPEKAVEVTYSSLRHELAQLLAIPLAEIRPDPSISGYGTDSLISIELKSWISGELGTQIEMVELMSSMPLTQLAETIAYRPTLIDDTVFGSSRST